MKVLLACINKLNEQIVGRDYIDKLADLTDFWIFNATSGIGSNSSYDIDIEKFTSEQQALDYAKNNKYNFIIGNLIGHLLRPGSKNNRSVLEYTIDSCQNSSGLIGHIIAHPGKIPYLHDEYWCVNMDIYRELGSPNWESNDTSVFPNFKRSTENFHSNYTPHYIESIEGNLDNIILEQNCGVGLIEKWFRTGRNVKNIPLNIRTLKHHLYPEDYNLLSQYFDSKIKVTELKQELQLEYFKQVDYDHAKDCIFLFNTDNLDFEVPNQPIDALISVCAAFRPYIILNKSGFNKNTVVKFIDYSPISLQFKEWLVKNWDGLDILKATVEFENVVGKKLNWNKPFNLTYQESYNQVIETFGNQSNWLVFWNKYRTLKHEFHLLDLVDNTEKIEDLLGNKQNYLYISNSFNTEAGLIKHGRTKLLSKFKQITEIAFKHNSVFDGSDLDHHYPNPDYIKNVVKYYNFL